MDARHRSARWHWRALACAIIVFATCEAILDLTIERHSELREPVFGYQFRRLVAMCRANPGKPLLVMLGSSHVQHAFCPGQLGPDAGRPLCFNLGVPGGGLMNQRMYLDRILRGGIHPRWLVCEACPGQLRLSAKWDECSSVGIPDSLEWRDFDTVRPYLADSGKVMREWIVARLCPALVHGTRLLYRCGADWLPTERRSEMYWCRGDDDGWARPPKTVTAEQARKSFAITREAFEDAFVNFQIQPIQDRALREIISRCKEERITPIVIMMPEGERLRSWYTSSAERVLTDYKSTLEQELHVQVLDTRRWLPESAFYDSHHAAYGGAIEFTQRLDRELLRTLLASR